MVTYAEYYLVGSRFRVLILKLSGSDFHKFFYSMFKCSILSLLGLTMIIKLKQCKLHLISGICMYSFGNTEESCDT